MLVRVKQMDQGDLGRLSTQEQNLYFGLRTSYQADRDIVILGIVVSASCTLYAICLTEDPDLLTFADAGFFSVSDHRASALWRVFPQTRVNDLVYGEVELGEALYIGVDRLATDPEFLRRYHAEDPRYLAYAKEALAALTAEAKSTAK
jgi:hypothetical protein